MSNKKSVSTNKNLDQFIQNNDSSEPLEGEVDQEEIKNYRPTPEQLKAFKPTGELTLDMVAREALGGYNFCMWQLSDKQELGELDQENTPDIERAVKFLTAAKDALSKRDEIASKKNANNAKNSQQIQTDIENSSDSDESKTVKKGISKDELFEANNISDISSVNSKKKKA